MSESIFGLLGVGPWDRLTELGQEILLSVHFEGSLTFMTLKELGVWDFLHPHRFEISFSSEKSLSSSGNPTN